MLEITINREKKEYTAQEFCDFFGVDYAKILSSPMFERTSLDPNAAIKYKRPSGMRFPARFTIRMKDGKNIGIRYYTSVTMSDDGKTEIYYPDKLFIPENFKICEDIEEAVFLYVHMFSDDSPYKKDHLVHFRMKDEAKIASNVIGSFTKLRELLDKIESTDEQTLKILYKGMGYATGGMLDQSIKASMMQLAANAATITRVEEAFKDNRIRFKGMVQDLVDGGYLAIDSVGIVKKWQWKKGSYAGLDLTPINDLPRAFDTLIAYISEHMDTMFGQVKNAHEDMVAGGKFNKFFEKDAKATESEFIPPGLMGAKEPKAEQVMEQSKEEEKVPIPVGKITLPPRSGKK